jgi:integrase
VPLVPELLPLLDRWSANRGPSESLFAAPEGGPLRESNWKRMVDGTSGTAAIGVPKLRVHDLRHTAASMWLGAGQIRRSFSGCWGTPQRR